MTRPRSVTIAAILLFVYCLWNAVQTVPQLAQGTANDSNLNQAPFAMSLFGFTLAIFGLFASYGLWRNMKWGKVLALVVVALDILYTLIPLLVAPLPIKIIAGGAIVYDIVIILLLLWRESKVVTA